jgi:hypothetical protein
MKFDEDRRYGGLCYFKLSNFAASSPPVEPQAVLALPVCFLAPFYKMSMI